MSTTVTGAKSVMRSYSICFRFSTILPSFPTPVGSMTRYSGSTAFAMERTDRAKSPLAEQQMQPSVISQMFTVPLASSVSSRSLSIPAAPYSFSKMANSLPVCFARALIKVVFPAPKKPDTISIFRGLCNLQINLQF